MSSSLSSSPTEIYRQYLQQYSVPLDAASPVLQNSAGVNWDTPESALDLNNFAVLSLIEADQAENAELRALHLDMALEALNTAIEQQPTHPLCTAHLALIQCMLGNLQEGINLAFATLLATLQPAYTDLETLPLGLVYLPSTQCRAIAPLHFTPLLDATDGTTQALKLLAWVLYHAPLAFYNPTSLRFLRLALPLLPDTVDLNFKLGLADCMAKQWEGLIHLHQAQRLAPNHAAILQALYLAYQEIQQTERAEFWRQIAQKQLQLQPHATEWQWATLEPNAPFTYIPFNRGLMLAVEPHLRSIVTTVLLGQGDWFEAEMELWRDQLQPGMVVVDVGANAGIYTFSAAQQVGATGRVLAVEPFSQCVQYLEKTRQINQLAWVTVYQGAASDHTGTARLSLHSASELNEVMREDGTDDVSKPFERVACFTLDDLVEREQLQRVDWLKIDAEKHEMQVLAGSDRLLSKFTPAILYENSLPAVAELLQSRGYHLFRYQPYLKTLIPIQSSKDLEGNLNIIALPTNHPLIP